MGNVLDYRSAPAEGHQTAAQQLARSRREAIVPFLAILIVAALSALAALLQLW